MRKLHLLFLLFTLLHTVEAATFYSRQNGAYDVSNTWSTSSHTGPAAGSPPCSCAPCNINGSTTLLIANALTTSCNLTYSGNTTIHIQAGGSLVVTGNANVSGSATFIVDAGATVAVTGNFSVNGGSASVTINGTMTINGNLTIASASTFCGTGNVNFGGTLSGTPCSTIVLPVTWTSVDAKINHGQVTISWQTAAEINNDYFTVERSADGSHFIPLTRIVGAGNSTSLNNYSWTDRFPVNGTNFYRIRQTDYDGENDCSAVVAVNVTGEDYGITVVPTIVHGDHVSILINGLKNETVDLSLCSAFGELLKRETHHIPDDKEELNFSLPDNLRKGTCFVLISHDQYYDCRKIIISR